MPEQSENNSDKETIPDEWMIRTCDVYEDEYSECRSIKARFHQYFIHGKTTDCTQWKRDADSCARWTNKQDMNAAKELIDSEKARRLVRLKGHYGNNVWTKRKQPPEDWNKPLPEYLQKEYEATYLNVKAKEMRGEVEPSFDTTSSCSII